MLRMARGLHDAEELLALRLPVHMSEVQWMERPQAHFSSASQRDYFRRLFPDVLTGLPAAGVFVCSLVLVPSSACRAAEPPSCL